MPVFWGGVFYRFGAVLVAEFYGVQHMVSHEYKCIFVHIPKTAGTSIEKKLGLFTELKWGVQDHTEVHDYQPLTWGELAGLAGQGRVKYALRDVRNRARGSSKRLTQEQFDSYFKFCFIRNSWARVYSWYHNVMRDEQQQELNGVKPGISFNEFLENHLRPDDHILKSQLSWITDNHNNVPMDFIGRFENLEHDMNFVCEKLGIDTDMPRLLKGSGKSYVDAYDDKWRAKVGEFYAEEIEHFGFKFGD